MESFDDEQLEGETVEYVDADEEEVDSDNDLMLPAEVLDQLTKAWINESLSPVVLPHKFDLVDCLIEQVEEMNKNISRLPVADKKHLKCTVHKIELLRISYIINSYLRERLKKIESDPVTVLKEDDVKKAENLELLSDKERAFTIAYHENCVNLLKEEFFQHLPPAMTKIPVPVNKNKTERVFFEVVEADLTMTVPNLMSRDDAYSVPLTKGSIHMAPFDSIGEFLEKDQVQLI